MYANSDRCLSDSALLAECRVAQLAFAMAIDLGLSSVVLEGDSLEVISLSLPLVDQWSYP